MDRNIKTYYIRQFFYNLYLILPVLVVFYQDLGFNLTQIFILQTIASLTTTVTNIPAGLIADRIGRKKVLLIGIFLTNLFIFFYYFVYSYFDFILLEILWGVGFSFITVEIPLVSDTLLKIGEEEKATEIFSKGNSILILSLITSNIILLFIFQFGYRFIILCTVFPSIISFFIALLGYKETRGPRDIKSENTTIHLKKMQNYWRKNNYLAYFILIGSLFISLSYIGFFFVQPYYEESLLPPESYGILFAITNTVELISTNLSYRIEKKLQRRSMILIINLCFIIAFLGMTFIFNIFAILFVIFRQIGYAFQVPIFNSYINEEITVMEKNELEETQSSRATIYSVYGMIANLIYAGLMPIMGFLADNYSLSFTALILFCTFSVLLILNIIFTTKLKRRI